MSYVRPTPFRGIRDLRDPPFGEPLEHEHSAAPQLRTMSSSVSVHSIHYDVLLGPSKPSLGSLPPRGLRNGPALISQTDLTPDTSGTKPGFPSFRVLTSCEHYVQHQHHAGCQSDCGKGVVTLPSTTGLQTSPRTFDTT